MLSPVPVPAPSPRTWPRATVAVVAAVLCIAAPAGAQERGFALHRYAGTSAGSWQFLVERPWYSDERTFALGLTVDASQNPLVPAIATGRGGIKPIVSEALLGHVDLAASLFERVLLTASLPVTLQEKGALELVSQAAPVSGTVVGDPRVGVMLRLMGRPERDPFSLHLGVDGWIPLAEQDSHQGDSSFRLKPRAVFAGTLGSHGRWGLEGAFLYRPYASLGPPALGMIAASEAQVGASLGLALAGGRIVLGPEARYSTQVVGDNAFTRGGMSLEVLAGLHWLLADRVLIGVAAGAGFLGAAGTPDARGLFRLAWAPRTFPDDQPAPVICHDLETGALIAPTNGRCPTLLDLDADGIDNDADRCPYEPETPNGIRDADGCPEAAMEPGSVVARILAPQANPPTVRAAPAVKATAPLEASRDAGAPAPAETPAPPAIAPTPTVADAGPTAPAAPPPATPAPTAAESVPDAGVAASPSQPVAEVPAPVSTSAAAPAPTASSEPPVVDAAEARAQFFALADADGDGVPDEADACPVNPEDQDGFEDEDGCPELDNDHDGIPDAKDQCVDVAETVNGIADDDGCPDTAPDEDGDGIPDAKDRCPLEPESLDGVRDEDGCPEHPFAAQEALSHLLAVPPPPPLTLPPEPVATAAATQPEAKPAAVEQPPADSDHDGIPDEEDRCPVTPEDKDGFQDEDGCPEPDNDDDGVPDAKDQCADAAEVVNGWKDEDGCPDEHQDVDGDGVEYEQDRCPLEPGNASDGCPHLPKPPLALPGFPNEAKAVTPAPTPEAGQPAPPAPPAGPPPDLDRDGLSDDADACPVSPEDKDGFEDEDGCPEPDNDQDGIPDAKDKCPLVAETINGKDDTDGCPDVGAGVVSISASRVVIDGVVNFKPGLATLEAKSLTLLMQVAGTLKAASTLSVEIQGHTDDVGNAAGNIRLSRRRAEAIRAVLIKAGVPAARLVANGYGPTRPRASNKTEAGREQNRRVEFHILGE